MADKDATAVHKGACLCGSVKYEVTGNPFTFFCCHCQNCKQFAGSSFASNAFFKPEQTRLIEGEETLRTYTDNATATGNPIQRTFCPNCGSSLFVKPKTEGIMIMCTGTLLDIPKDWLPRKEGFEHVKDSWVCEIRKTEKKPSL